MASRVRGGYDTGSLPSGGGTISLTSLDFGAAVTDGCLFVTVICRWPTSQALTVDVNATTSITAVAAARIAADDDPPLGIQTFRLLSPPSGTGQQIDVNGAAHGNGNGPAIVFWEIWEDVDQTTPTDNNTGGDGTASTANIVSSATVTSESGDGVYTAHGTFNGSEVLAGEPTNYTEHQDVNNAAGLAAVVGSAAGAASVATSTQWDNSAITVYWIAQGFNVNAAAAGSSALPSVMRHYYN